MNDAWTVLNLNPSASDEAIRRRYLQLVREFSPESHPAQFMEIRKAYDEVRNPIERVRRRLFADVDDEELDRLISESRRQASSVRIPTSTLLNLANGP